MLFNADLILAGSLDQTWVEQTQENVDNIVKNLLIEQEGDGWIGELHVYPEGQSGGEFAGETTVHYFMVGHHYSMTI